MFYWLKPFATVCTFFYPSSVIMNKINFVTSILFNSFNIFFFFIYYTALIMFIPSQSHYFNCRHYEPITLLHYLNNNIIIFTLHLDAYLQQLNNYYICRILIDGGMHIVLCDIIINTPSEILELNSRMHSYLLTNIFVK